MVQRIVQAKTGSNGENSYVVCVYTTNTGSGITTGNAFGTSYYLVNKNEDGSYTLQGKLKYDAMWEKCEYKDISDEHLKLQGFGRIGEKKIEGSGSGSSKESKDKPQKEKE